MSVMKINAFADILLYSNSNIEKTVRSVINESSNAALVALYEKSAILLDHKKGNLYTCNYSFDPKKGILMFEEFDEIELESNDDELKESIFRYFDDDNTIDNLENMKEAFEDNMVNNDQFFRSVFSEAIASKNFEDVIDYSDLEGISEEVEDVRKMPFFKAYQERLEKKPLTTVMHFDWNRPVRVSLIENEGRRYVSRNAKAKALTLSKDAEFKKSLIESFKDLMEGDDERVIALAEDYPNLFLLDRAQRKEVIGKSILTNQTLLDNRSKLLEAFEDLYESDDRLEEVRNYVFEADDEDGPTNGSGTGNQPAVDTDDEDGSKKDEGEEDDDAKELTDAEAEKLLKALEAALEKTSDPKLTNKIETLQKAVEDGKDEGTDVNSLKEAVELLSL